PDGRVDADPRGDVPVVGLQQPVDARVLLRAAGAHGHKRRGLPGLQDPRRAGKGRPEATAILRAVDRSVDERGRRACIVVVAVLLTFATVYLQWFVLGHDFIEGTQNARHRRVLLGVAPDPWPDRVLSEWLVHGAIAACRALGLERPIVWGFLSFRVVQNLAIFLLAARYYSALGIGFRGVLLGLG